MWLLWLGQSTSGASAAARRTLASPSSSTSTRSKRRLNTQPSTGRMNSTNSGE